MRTDVCCAYRKLQFFVATLVLATALLITLSYCSAENVYCVTPTATSCSSCPHNTHCATLSEYAREAELYFTSNTTMAFLPGDHTLDTNITVANVARLTMHGESSSSNRATVVCSGSVGLNFISMVDLKIYSLAFTSCSRRYVLNLSAISYAITAHFVLLLQSTQHAELVNCSFHDNNATALGVNSTNITLSGNTEFKRNRACGNSVAGGGVGALNSNLTFTGNTTFLDNSATFGHCPFENRSTLPVGGGAIFVLNNTVLSFSGTSNFIGNSAGDRRGGAIYISYHTVLSFTGTTNFINNSAYLGGAIYTGTICKMTFNGTIYFSNNGAKVDTQNEYTNGGGVFMRLKSTLFILPNTTVYWENNHASLGGAIYVENANFLSHCLSAIYLLRKVCFFQLPGQNLSNGIDVQLFFKNNSADDAGSVLYGGAIDNCKLTHGLDSHSSGEVFDMIVHTDNDTEDNTTSTISSDPLKICPCENNHPDCSKSWYKFPRTVYPGETFQVSVVAVGQRDGTVPSTVRSAINNRQYPGTNLQGSQYLQQANNTCTKLNYTVFSLSQRVDIELSAENKLCPDNLQIKLWLYQTCPPGFNFSQSARSCVCQPRLASSIETYQCDYTTCTQCTIRNGVGQITRYSGQQFWVGYDNQLDEVILYPRCPYDYCVSQAVVFSLDKSEVQCANNRSGLLCGACKEGYSLVLGTSQCWNCTNNYHLALVIPFAVMGVALVFLLFVCKLTVATGTLSGLVFYANIVGVNRTIFLPVKSANPLLSVFIAWLNLDFGVETCFYDGMDAYSKTWLQFVFPVYIWFLVGLMITVSHFSHRFAKLLGNNPVSVLATLILLSYTKILRTLITVFQITYLEYPTYNRRVWLLDANVDSTCAKHIPLTIVAVLVLLFLFLPYTLLLLFGQWLQAISHLRLFSWVNNARLKPFMDAYHAPYKAKHRYWPGLLLVLRFVLLLVFTLNPQEDPSINLLAILVEVVNLFLWLSISGGVYTNRYVNVLEGSFALNLIILTAVTYSVNVLNGGQHFIVRYSWTASVSIAFATFIGILGFQLANVTGITPYLKRKYTALKIAIRHQAEAGPKSPTDSLPDRLTHPEEYELPFLAPKGHATAGPTEGEGGAGEAQEPVYTA